MGFQDLQDVLGDLPLIGLIFQGSPIAVGLKLLVLLALVIVGWKVVQTLQNWLSSRKNEEPKYVARTTVPPSLAANQSSGDERESLSTLVKHGRLEEAGDHCLQAGDVSQALVYFEEGGAWSKAGHTAQRLKQNDFAALCFERAGEFGLAAELYFEAGKYVDAERIAFEHNDKEVLAKAAEWRASNGELRRAAKLYNRAEMLTNAEQCCLKIPDDGPKLAAQLYLKAYDKAAALDPTAVRTRQYAHRAAELLELCDQPKAADALREQAGLETGGGRIERAAEIARPPSTDGSAYDSDNNGSNRDLRASDSDVRASNSDVKASNSDLRASNSDARASNSDLEFSDSGLSATPSSSPPSPGQDLAIESPLLSVDEFIASSAAEEPTELDSTPQSDPLPMVPTDGASKTVVEARYETKFGTEATSRYELIDELGRGGMAEVYKARDRALGRTVALKFLSSALIGDKTAMRLFAREARAAAALNHPGIVTIYDIGVLDNRPYISMEFIDGEDLRSVLSNKGPLKVVKAVDLGVQLARGLDYAHERSVIHRDIKPANVIIAGDESVKILDFGVAKAIQGGKAAASILAGTPQYMSPEQLSQGDLDGRSDTFSLGVLIFRALTGKRPFKGIQRQAEIRPASSHAPWVPESLDDIVLKAVALDPDDRYQRARDLAEALEGALEDAEDLDDGPTFRED